MSTKLAIARFIVIKNAPYLTTAVLALVPKPVEDLAAKVGGPFAVTESGVMLYDPVAVDKWSNDEVAAVYFHETLHLVQDHASRRRQIDAHPGKFNIAADLEINDDLQAGKWKLPKGGLLPSQFGLQDGLTAEAYYAALPDPPPQKAQGGGESGAGGAGEDDGDQEAGGGEEGVDGKNAGPPGEDWGGNCGSGAGNPSNMEKELVGDTEGRSHAELERARRAVASEITKTQKSQGWMPGSLRRWADGYLAPPVVPWQTILARTVRRAVQYRAGLVDYSYQIRNARQGGFGTGIGKVILPGLHAPVPEVAVVVDTSGSMGSAEFVAILAEVKGILASTGAPARFISADAVVHDNVRVNTVSDAAKNLSGGGGTDFRPAFEALKTAKPKPSIIIYATDGYGTAPAEAPKGVEVVWLLVGRATVPAPWGKVVEIPAGG